MTVFQIISLALMAGFYGVYLAKQFSQSRQGIRTNQMGRGNKERRTLAVERLLAAFSVLIVVVEVWSVVRGYSFLPQWCGWIGLVLTALGVVFFTAAVLQMRDSWRAGISPDEKTGLVTSGIYSVSRNPAFVGFDLTYIGLLLCFANWLHLIVVLLYGDDFPPTDPSGGAVPAFKERHRLQKLLQPCPQVFMNMQWRITCCYPAVCCGLLLPVPEGRICV